MELARLVSGRLALPEGMTERMLAARPTRSSAEGDRAGRGISTVRVPAGTGGTSAPRRALSRREQVERAFLAFCIAFPKDGEEALADVEMEEHFTGEALRSAAALPTRGEPRVAADERSGGRCGALADDRRTRRAGGRAEGGSGRARRSRRPPGRRPWRTRRSEPRVSAETATAKVRVQRLQLELARLEREIQAATARHGGEVSEVAARREEVKREFDQAQQRALEMAGTRAADSSTGVGVWPLIPRARPEMRESAPSFERVSGEFRLLQPDSTLRHAIPSQATPMIREWIAGCWRNVCGTGCRWRRLDAERADAKALSAIGLGDYDLDASESRPGTQPGDRCRGRLLMRVDLRGLVHPQDRNGGRSKSHQRPALAH